jgi:hypothetical protein
VITPQPLFFPCSQFIQDFFFRFSWNNFLHNVVYDVVQQVFNGTLDRGYNRTLALDLFRPIELKDGESAKSVGFVSTKESQTVSLTVKKRRTSLRRSATCVLVTWVT